MKQSGRLTIVYTYPVAMSFVRNDESLLKEHFNVKPYHFLQVAQVLPWSFLKQFWFLIRNIFATDVYVSFFAGYSTILPTIFAKLTGRKHFIILGGTECASFPEINYGNYRKRALGAATRFSIRRASHLIPVDKSLIDCDYGYMPVMFKKQGYMNFCSHPSVPATVIPIGYDPDKFYCREQKKPNSFLTVGQMNPANYYRKGVDLIFAMARKFPDCTFTIVGHTKSMVYPEAVPANVELLGFVPYDELRHVYATHEYYLQLSLMEGFPSAPCEAMLCECIPIVSSVAALPQIAGNSGFILQQKNVDALETLLREALKVERRTSGENARKHIINHFPKSIRNALIDLIKMEAN